MAEYRGRFSKENDRLKNLLKKFIDKYKKDNPGVSIGTNTLKEKIQELWGLDPQGKTTQRPTHKLSNLRRFSPALFKGIKVIEGEMMYDPKTSRWSSRVGLKNQLEKFMNDYKKKNKTGTIDTQTLARKVEDIFKVKNGPKVLAALRENNPDLFKGTNIVYGIKGQAPWHKAWENDPEFRKFFKEKNPGVKWENVSTEKRHLKSGAWKSFNVFKERSKNIPKNYISLTNFSEKVGALPSYIKTVRVSDRYSDLNSKINKAFKPMIYKREVFYPDPSKEQISDFKKLVKDYRESGIKSMSEKKQSVSYEPIKAIHRELIRDPNATPAELAEAIYGKANAKNLKNIGNDSSMYVEFLSGSRKVPGIIAPTLKVSENILGNILMPGSGFFNFGNAERRNAMLKERDALLGITDRSNKLFSIRGSLVKKLKNQGFNIDEAMGLSATYERAPGYTELAQITSPEINYLKGNTIDKDFSRIFDKVIKGEQNIGEEIKKFNQDSRAFQKNYNVDTPIIEYKPGEKLNASKFVKNFTKLTPEAQANVTQLADQGIALRSKAMPMGALKAMPMEALLDAVKKAPQACRTILNYQTGGISSTCAAAIEADPNGAANKLKNLDVKSGPLKNVKDAANNFLQAFKTPGSFRGKVALGAGAVIGGGGAAALVQQFRNDNPNTYLTNDRQMEGMIIADDIERDLDDMGFILDNEGKIELAATGALSASMVKKVYNAARAGEAQLLEMPTELDQEARALRKTIKQILYKNGRKVKRITESGQQVIRESRDRLSQIENLAKDTKLRGTTGDLVNPGRSGRIMSALGLRKGVLGLGLSAFMSPAVALPTAAMSVARDIKSGKSTEDTLTNPFTYLPTAFMKSGMKGLAKMGATRGLMGIAGLGLGAVAAAPVVGALSIAGGLATLGSMGYQGYKMFKDRNRTDEDFFN